MHMFPVDILGDYFDTPPVGPSITRLFDTLPRGPGDKARLFKYNQGPRQAYFGGEAAHSQGH